MLRRDLREWDRLAFAGVRGEDAAVGDSARLWSTAARHTQHARQDQAPRLMACIHSEYLLQQRLAIVPPGVVASNRGVTGVTPPAVDPGVANTSGLGSKWDGRWPFVPRARPPDGDTLLPPRLHSTHPTHHKGEHMVRVHTSLQHTTGATTATTRELDKHNGGPYADGDGAGEPNAEVGVTG